MKYYLTSRLKRSGAITVCITCPHCGFSERVALKGLQERPCTRCGVESERGRYYTKDQLVEAINQKRRGVDLRQKAAVSSICSGIYPDIRPPLREQRRAIRYLADQAAFYGMTTDQQQRQRQNNLTKREQND